MSRRKLLIAIVVSAAAGAALAVWLLDARVDRLTMATRVGISAGPATPETERLYDDWWQWLDISNTLAGLALWFVILSGVPLAVVTMVFAYWPNGVAFIMRNRAAVRLCLALQAMNLGFAVLLLLVAAVEFVDAPLAMALFSAAYLITNFLAVRVWRDRLLHLAAR